MNHFTKKDLDCKTLKWMRHLLPSSAVSNSLTDMLIEKEKNKPFLLRLLEDKKLISSIAKQQTGNHPFMQHIKQLKPELLFQKSTLDKIYQLRDIFLEFDEDRSRTLEISELFKMFNSNGIPVSKDELIDLFTWKTEEKKQIWEYKLTFLDFVEFSLSDVCEVKFRELMKKIKQRMNQQVYFPMTLKQSLEYIFNKGKINTNIKKIQRGIKKIETFEKKKNFQNDDSKYQVLKKMGINKGINVNMICKCFSNVLAISREQLEQLEKQMEEKEKIKQIKYQIKKKAQSFNLSNSPLTKIREFRLKSHTIATDVTLSTYCNTEKDQSLPGISKSIQYHPINNIKKRNASNTAQQCYTFRSNLITSSNKENKLSEGSGSNYEHKYKFMQKQFKLIGNAQNEEI